MLTFRKRAFAGFRLFVVSLLCVACSGESTPGIGADGPDWHVPQVETLPYSAALDQVMTPDPLLLDFLVSEFMEEGQSWYRGQTIDPKSFWIAFHFWIMHRYCEAAARGDLNEYALRRARWITYASVYWGGVEVTQNYSGDSASAPAPEEPAPAQPAPPAGPTDNSAVMDYIASVNHAGVIAKDGSAEAKVARARAALREPILAPPYGALINGLAGGTAYDVFYEIVIGEAPPTGQRNPALQEYQPNNVVADPARFLEVEYADPIADYLARSRRDYQAARAAHPLEFEQLLVGASTDAVGGPGDLRVQWASSHQKAHALWGNASMATAGWTQEYLNLNLHGTTRWNWGLEAATTNAFTAALTGNERAAEIAIDLYGFFVGAWNGYLMGSSAPETAVLPAPERR